MEKWRNLAASNFKLGEDTFFGTKEDIKTTEEMDWETYIGITLDTRIFNRLFKRS